MARNNEALRNRHLIGAERCSEHTVRLTPLVVSDHVRIQNQIGRDPRKWDKTGIVIEVKQFDQYVVKVDGSGRVTLRNRKFLRQYTPVPSSHPRLDIECDLAYKSQHLPLPSAINVRPNSPTKPQGGTPDVGNSDRTVVSTDITPSAPLAAEPSAPSEETTPVTPQPPRRSGRITRPPAWHTDFKMDLPP